MDKIHSYGIKLPTNRLGNEGYFNSIALSDLESQIREVLKRCLSYKIVEEVPVIKYQLETNCTFSYDKNGNIVPNPSKEWTGGDENGEWRDGTSRLDALNAQPFGFSVYAKPFLKRVIEYGNGETKVEYSRLNTEKGTYAHWLNCVTSILNRSYERLNVINEGVVPAVEGCVGYTNEEFERVNKENNDPESAKIGSFNKTVEKANNIRSRVLKYVDKIKQERAYNIDLCMTFERYIEIADKDAERAMAFLKEAYPFNEETEVFIRKRYNMSIDVNPEEN